MFLNGRNPPVGVGVNQRQIYELFSTVRAQFLKKILKCTHRVVVELDYQWIAVLYKKWPEIWISGHFLLGGKGLIISVSDGVGSALVLPL